MSLHAPADDIAEAQTPTAPPPAAPRKSLLARAGPLVFARILSAVITFAIPLALARAFVPEDYGTYKQLILISTTLYFVLPFGMPQSLYYFVPRASAPRPFIAHTLLFLLAAGAVGFGCMVLGAEAIARSLNNPGLVQYMPMLGVYTFALIASMPLEPALTARGRTKMAGLLYVGSDTVKAVAMTAPALLGYGLQGVVVGITVFAGVRLVATWAALLPGSGPLVDRALLVRQLRYTIPFGLAVAVAVPQKYFQQSVVSSALTPAAFAVYAVGIFQVPLFDLLYTPTSEMLMVHLAELDREKRPASEGAAAFREAILKLAWFFIPAVFFLFAVAPEFITTLFTDKYAAAVPIFRIGIGAGLLACIPVEGALRARGQTRHILVGNLVKAAISVPLVLVLVAHFGMIGGIV